MILLILVNVTKTCASADSFLFFYLLLVCITGLFDQSIGDVSNKYYLYITPAGWTFGIWSCIYILLGAMIVYCKYFFTPSSNTNIGATICFYWWLNISTMHQVCRRCTVSTLTDIWSTSIRWPSRRCFTSCSSSTSLWMFSGFLPGTTSTS